MDTLTLLPRSERGAAGDPLRRFCAAAHVGICSGHIDSLAIPGRLKRFMGQAEPALVLHRVDSEAHIYEVGIAIERICSLGFTSMAQTTVR